MRRLMTILSVTWLVGVLAATLVLSGPAGAAGDVTVEAGASGVNVRQGPGDGYPLIGVLQARAKATALAYDPVSGWLQIPFDRAPGGKGWIRGDGRSVTVAGALSNLPRAVDSPTPAPPSSASETAPGVGESWPSKRPPAVTSTSSTPMGRDYAS